jgi:type II secretion system protein G
MLRSDRTIRATCTFRRASALPVAIVVICAIGLAGAVGWYWIVWRPDHYDVRHDVARLLVDEVACVLERYNRDMDRYPRGEDGGLQALLTAPTDAEAAKKWQGPYVVPRDLKDVWGNDLIYVCPGRHNPKSFDLFSHGRDGVESDDDITNWEKAP